MPGIETALIILLGIGFVILLAVTLSLLVIVVRIARSVQRITERAEVASESLSGVVGTVARKLAPSLITTALAVFLKRRRK